MNSTWIEIKKFIKYSFKKIIISSLILGTVLAAIIFFVNKDVPGSSEKHQDSETKPETSIAYFQYYSEREDGSALTNLSVVREYFSREELIKDWANELDISLDNIAVEDELIFTGNSVLENEEDSVEQTTEILDENVVNLKMYKGDYSHLFTLTVTSQNEQKNLEIIEYYYNLIEDEKIPFYQDKHVYIFTKPQISERLIKVDDTQEITLEENNSSNLYTVLFGYVLSFILIIGYLILKSLFSSYLNYSFSYLWDEKDLFLLYDPHKHNLNELVQFLSYPENNKKVFLTQNKSIDNLYEIFSEAKFELGDDLLVYDNITDFKFNDEISEIILLVNEGETTRKWYKEQQSLLSIYNHALVKIVQINQ